MDNTFREAVLAARKQCLLESSGLARRMYDVSAIPGAEKLPRSLVVLLENVVRRAVDDEAAVEAAARVVEAGLAGTTGAEIEFMPARVLFQDFTGVPVFVDFAAMRDAMVERGGDPKKVNPKIPCTLIVDHSIIADCAGCADAAEKNELLEAKRNRERFASSFWRPSATVSALPSSSGPPSRLTTWRSCRPAAASATS
jgi:aconitate hydratase